MKLETLAHALSFNCDLIRFPRRRRIEYKTGLAKVLLQYFPCDALEVFSWLNVDFDAFADSSCGAIKSFVRQLFRGYASVSSEEHDQVPPEVFVFFASVFAIRVEAEQKCVKGFFELLGPCVVWRGFHLDEDPIEKAFTYSRLFGSPWMIKAAQ